MKQFFRYVLGSCLGIFLFLFVLAIIGGALGLSTVVKDKFSKKFKEDAILVLDGGETIPEKTNNVDQGFSFEQDDVVGLHATTDIIEDAKTNDKIKGLYINLSALPTRSYSNARILRNAILDFRESGKWVYAYSDLYTQGAYYMASAADSVFINPAGGIDFRGLATEILFYKETLDKLGIQPEVFYAGKFKSASEPIRRNDMSPENRLQIRKFINDIYSVILEDISDSRSLSVNRLNEIADQMLTSKAGGAVACGMVDAALYKDQFLDLLKSRVGAKKYKDLKFINTKSYYSKLKKDKSNKKADKIAVVIAEGSIQDYNDANGIIDGDRYAKIIRKLREDDKVKAIVLRVSSPGGSVLASNKIWRELVRAQEDSIVVVASMGDYAASGGYYISCMADSIFAQPNTITGSIGVYGINYNFNELATKTLGFNVDTVRTNRFSALGGNILPTDEGFKAHIQRHIDSIYIDFKSKVSEGRNLSMDRVEEIAQGRVWTGQEALKLDLVDKMGNLEDAIASASNILGVDDYNVVYYPKVKKPLDKILEDLTGAKSELKRMETAIESVFPEYRQIKELRAMNQTVQARLPFEMKFE